MAQESPGPSEYRLMDILRTEKGVLSLGTARVVLMSEAGYSFLLQVIHENSPHIVKYAFYDMGYRAGEQLINNLPQDRQDPEKAFRYVVETYRQAGFGDLEVVSFDINKPEAVLRGVNLFESGLAKQANIYRSPRAVDHYTRGMFAGFMSVLAGEEVVCEEMACEYRGDKACEFIILPFSGGQR